MIVRMPFFIRSGGNTNTSLPLMWYISTWPKYTTLCDYTLQVSTWLGFRHIHLAGFSTVISVTFVQFHHLVDDILQFVTLWGKKGLAAQDSHPKKPFWHSTKRLWYICPYCFDARKICQWLCKLLAKCGALPDVVQAIYCKHCQMWLNGPTQQEPQCDFDCSHVAVLVRNALKE